MSRRLKVFGGLAARAGVAVQVRTIVATTSQREAAAKVGVTLHEFSRYWCETSNAEEIRAATSNPGQVFQSSGQFEHDFVAVRR